MSSRTVTAPDGGSITVYSTGAGPGVVILHGGGISVREYGRLATRLADRCTVHLYNRRGRPDSPPIGDTDTVDTDLGDLAAVLRHTGADTIFGHSGGGFVALRAGLGLPGAGDQEVPLRRIAVYDPALCLAGRPSFDFLTEYTDAVAAGDNARAMTVMGRGVYPDDAAAKLPFGVAMQVSRAFMLTPVGRRMVALLPTAPAEIRRIAEHDGPPSDYAGIGAQVLLVAGSRSPAYFTQNCEALAAAIPGGRSLVVKGSHNAPNIASPAFVRPFADFFTGQGANVVS